MARHKRVNSVESGPSLNLKAGRIISEGEADLQVFYLFLLICFLLSTTRRVDLNVTLSFYLFLPAISKKRVVFRSIGLYQYF